jgi:hypothetical protein
MATPRWIHGLEALSPTLNFLWSEPAVKERLFPRLPGLPVYRATLQEIPAASNNLLFQIVEDMWFTYSDGAPASWHAASVPSGGLELQLRAAELAPHHAHRIAARCGFLP